MLAQGAALPRIALLPRHRADVERIAWRLIRRLLQLPAIDELDVGHRRPSRLPRVLVVEPASESGQHGREIIVERGYCTLSDDVGVTRKIYIALYGREQAEAAFRKAMSGGAS